MAKEHPRLKLGKRASFVKTHLKQLPQEKETWEADFRPLPKPPEQTETHYLGLVVALPKGDPLVYMPVEYTPTVNDLADLLADAMRRPLTGSARRPRTHSLSGQPSLGRIVSASERTRHRSRDPRRTRRTGRSASGLSPADAQGGFWPNHHAVSPGPPPLPSSSQPSQWVAEAGLDRDRAANGRRFRGPGDGRRRADLRGRQASTPWPRRRPLWRRGWASGLWSKTSNWSRPVGRLVVKKLPVELVGKGGKKEEASAFARASSYVELRGIEPLTS